MRRAGLSVAIILSVACTAKPPATGRPAPPPATASAPDPYDDSRLLQVAVEIDGVAWDELRFQHHPSEPTLGENCLSGPAPRPYTYFDARVTIDGQVFEGSRVRKKGFLGSVNSRRPSLKVVLGGEWRGISRLTLNNNQQDPSNLHQCLAYRVFRDAGVPAPRCALAHVTVNGVDKGVFSHVEPIRKPFLRRHFADDSGDLYEGTLSDFRPEWINTFQRKGDTEGDSGDLQAVASALAGRDLGALGRAIDLDAFYTFWAAETLVGHWDGYTNDSNNFYLYRRPASPASGRGSEARPDEPSFYFIPWGADSAFGDPDPFARGEPPVSVYAVSAVPQFLYSIPETRDRYIARLRRLLAEVWKEDALIAHVDRLVALATPRQHLSEELHAAKVTKVKTFIRGRRAAIEGELASGPEDWTLPLRSSPCPEKVGTASGDFAAPWGSLEAPDFTSGLSKLKIELDGESLAFTAVGAASAIIEEGGERPSVVLVGVQSGGPLVIALLMVDAEKFQPGNLPIDSYDVFGIILTLQMGSQPKGAGGFRGKLSLRQTGDQTPGSKVSGSFSADIVRPKYFSDPMK